MANSVRVSAQVTGVGKASSDLDRLKDKFEKLQKGGSKGFAIGAGAAITAGAFGQLAGAASSVIGVLGGAIEAAREDEASIQKLGTALKANIPAWDGNTDAIERVIKARMALGFSDDEQRSSLALLVAATGDANKALDIQRTAMDLARFKGISLADATEALTKVEGGSFRVLKSLGIELKDNATQTEALAAVQKVAADQAADWAKTNSGQLLVSQVKMDEALENFGTKVMPSATAAVSVLADGIGILSDAAANALGPFAVVAETIGQVGNAVGEFFSGADISPAAERNFDRFADKAGEMATSVDSSFGPDGVEGTMDDVGDAATRMRRRGMKAAKDMADSFETARGDMATTAQGMIDDFFDPIETRNELIDQKAQLRADMEALRLAKTKGEHHDASAAIVQDIDDQATSLIELGKKGKLTETNVKRFTRDTTAAYKAMGLKVPPELQKIIDKINELARLKGGAIKINVTGHVTGTGPLEKAAGGPVTAGQTFLVGEQGPELFVPTSSGRIVPNHRLSSASSSSGSVSVTVVVNPSMGMTPGDGRAFGEAAGPALVAWMQRRNLLPRGAGLTG